MKKFLSISLAAVVVLAFSATAMAKSPLPPPSGVIYACYKKMNGQLRIVSAANQCLPSEVSLSWNIVGPPGPQGPSGVVATSTFSGSIGTINSGSSQWVFAGPTANVTTTATQRITGAAQAPLGILTTGSTATFGYDLCYRTAGTTNALTNFSGSTFSTGEVTDTAGRLSFTAAASVVPTAGTWEVGYCILNSGSINLDNTDMVNGWVIVTEE